MIILLYFKLKLLDLPKIYSLKYQRSIKSRCKDTVTRKSEFDEKNLAAFTLD